MKVFFVLLIVLVASGCNPYTYMTILEHPETGETFICRTDNPEDHWTLARDADDKCVRQFESLGYKIKSRSKSAQEE